MRKINRDKFLKAMEDYGSGQFTITVLARRYGVSSATIANWAQEAGLPRRVRGRPRLTGPSPRQQTMIQLSRKLSVAEIAAQLGLSRQRVHQVLRRWHAPEAHRAELVGRTSAPDPVRGRKPQTHVVSLRLTARQIESIRLILKSQGLPMRLSKGAACRALLLSTLAAMTPSIAREKQGRPFESVGPKGKCRKYRLPKV